MRPSFQQQLPVGTSSFERLIFQNQVYVDKTAQICELLENGQKYFLTRPRRFGKSLLLSTFESLFRYGLRDFRGLEIEKRWDEQPASAVLSLDFSRIKGFQDALEFGTLLSKYLASRLVQEKIIPGMPAPDAGELVFADWLTAQPTASTVILIDEYDTPLTECLGRPELFREVRAILSRFYALLKSEDRALRFLFITGITKFTKASIFSELNNLKDISLSPQFGTLLGYTEEEIRKYFPERLQRAAEIRGTGVPALMDDLRRHYDGYCFDSAASTHVYAPWSVLNFLAYPAEGFKNYWLESGGKPSALTGYFRTHALRSPASLASEKCVSLEALASASDLEDLDDLVLLTQAGYLTVKRVEEDLAFLGFPNLEVKRSMARLCASALLGGKTFAEAGAAGIAHRLASERPEDVVRLFNRLFAATSFEFFKDIRESDVQAILFAFLAGGGLEPKPEHHGSRGRSDLEVVSGSRAWVFEIKVRRKGEAAGRKLDEAIAQIKAKAYGEQYDTDRLEVFRMGLVFSEEQRKITEWGLASES